MEEILKKLSKMQSDIANFYYNNILYYDEMIKINEEIGKTKKRIKKELTDEFNLYLKGLRR